MSSNTQLSASAWILSSQPSADPCVYYPDGVCAGSHAVWVLPELSWVRSTLCAPHVNTWLQQVSEYLERGYCVGVRRTRDGRVELGLVAVFADILLAQAAAELFSEPHVWHVD